MSREQGMSSDRFDCGAMRCPTLSDDQDKSRVLHIMGGKRPSQTFFGVKRQVASCPFLFFSFLVVKSRLIQWRSLRFSSPFYY